MDLHSHSNFHQVRTSKLNLELHINFETKCISGIAIHQIEFLETCHQFIVDTQGLIIESVLVNGTETSFQLEEEIEFIGSALKIPIDKETTTISISYKTTPTAGGLQWLNPEQTFGKEFPFLYSQSQAILARTWIPCQDSPANKFSWEAKISNDLGLPVVMSANHIKEQEQVDYFKMPFPVPSYLVSLACGNLNFQPINPRCGVFAEPEMLEKAHQEFKQMGLMLQVAENLYGAYVWDRFDVLLLPPAFPYGGMENPMLTFATPSLIAGDQSLANVIAHELAHSWSGNLITNSSWNDFWLNEGFTVYFERRIMEEIEGKDYADLLAMVGYYDLEKDMTRLGNHHPDTRLHYQMEGRDPDDGMTHIPYEKGFFFLKFLEGKTGRKDWDQWIRDYFKEFAFESIDTDTFSSFLKNHPTTKDLTDQDISAWINEPGLPKTMQVPNSKLYEEVKHMVESIASLTPAQETQMKNWNAHQWVLFLNQIPKETNDEKLLKLDKIFAFSKSKNAEVLFSFLAQVIKKELTEFHPLLEEYLCNNGRRKLIEPLYRLLNNTQEGKKMAKSIYAKAKPLYHYITRKTLEEML